MKTKDTPIKLIKCSCGYPSCDYYGFSDGRFVQGTGWDKATAKKHLLAINLYADMVAALMDVHPTIADDKMRARIGELIVKALEV